MKAAKELQVSVAIDVSEVAVGCARLVVPLEHLVTGQIMTT